MNANEFWDYCHRSENEERFLDLSRGRIVEWQRPTIRQGVVATKIGVELHQYSERVGAGYVSTACGITLGPARETVRGMSVGDFTDRDFLWSESRWDGTPPRVAVLSRGPDDVPEELAAAVADFHEYGTPLVWLVDIPHRSLEIHRLGKPISVLSAEDTLTGDPDLPDFAVTVAEIVRLPGEPAPQPPATPT